MELSQKLKSCVIPANAGISRPSLMTDNHRFVLVSPKNRTAYNFRGDLIREIIQLGYEVYVTGPNRMDVDKIEELGAHFVEISMNKNGINIREDIRYTLSLYRLFRKLKPNVVLGYTIKPVIYGTIAAWIAKVPHRFSMITGAGYLFANQSLKANILRKIASLLYKISFKNTGKVIFQNADDLEEFVARNLLKLEKCCVVNGSGVNMQKFQPAAYPEKITFFMLSRMIYSKGVMQFFQAAEKVKSVYPDARFVILGNIEKMQDAVSQEELNFYVQRNIVEHHPETFDVQSVYADCSVFVLPTYYREGTPRVILEAMAMARPIITTNTPGCRTTVKEGVTGFLISPKNTDVLAEKMIWFIRNPEQIPVMGKASYEYCKLLFDVNIVNNQMLAIMNLSS